MCAYSTEVSLVSPFKQNSNIEKQLKEAYDKGYWDGISHAKREQQMKDDKSKRTWI